MSNFLSVNRFYVTRSANDTSFSKISQNSWRLNKASEGDLLAPKSYAVSAQSGGNQMTWFTFLQITDKEPTDFLLPAEAFKPIW